MLGTLFQGDIFAAPALLGNGIAPATVTAETDVEVLTTEREVLLAAIRENPEIALRILAVFNQRLQQLHSYCARFGVGKGDRAAGPIYSLLCRPCKVGRLRIIVYV
ncbi:cyclic nucleotide-binding domain-containing protein [Microcoleus sp. M2_C6]|uniref:cyclic nucleotide-binding domain-containing protein n=1 Tax=unclassified Microcoleus TaxID=2642155 RepID=UPI002FD030DB